MTRRILYMTIGSALCLTSAGAIAQAIHTPFQTRAVGHCEPFTRFDRSPAAARIFQCVQDRDSMPTGPTIYLIKDMASHVEAARAQTTFEATIPANVGVDSRTYPIRGTYKQASWDVVNEEGIKI